MQGFGSELFISLCRSEFTKLERHNRLLIPWQGSKSVHAYCVAFSGVPSSGDSNVASLSSIDDTSFLNGSGTFSTH